MTHPIKITQAELQKYLDLEREIAWKKNDLEHMQSNLLALLRGGADVEEGRFGAELMTRIGRNVAWKQEFIERLGEATAEEVKRKYKTHSYYEVLVKEYAVPPLWRNGTGESGIEN